MSAEKQLAGEFKMDMELVRLFVRQVLAEEKNKNLLGEPDTTTEKHRDEPQPQYEEEEETEEIDTDEASVTGGITGYTGPLGASGHGPGNKPYGSDEDEN